MMYVSDIVDLTDWMNEYDLFLIIQVLLVYGLDLNMLAEASQTIEWITKYW